MANHSRAFCPRRKGRWEGVDERTIEAAYLQSSFKSCWSWSRKEPAYTKLLKGVGMFALEGRRMPSLVTMHSVASEVSR